MNQPVRVEGCIVALVDLSEKILNSIRPFAKHKCWAVILVAFLAIAGSASLSAVVNPAPGVHDEFSILLAADTYAHGRLTNPTHPLWRSFETFHVLQQPTYASKYPPVQGLILGLGQKLTGHAIAGVWLSMGLACGAICWMLQAWLPSEWALLGGLLSVVRLVFYGISVPDSDLIGYWSQSYFGGAMPAFAGALFLGALRRLADKNIGLNAIWLALGLVILANTRPFEGLLVAIVSGLLFFPKLSSIRPAILVKKIIAPTVIILSIAAAAMCFYNYEVTGKPFLLPYAAYEARYGGVPAFLFEPLPPAPHFNNLPMKQFYEKQELKKLYLRQRTVKGYLVHLSAKLIHYWGFYLGFWLTLPLVALPRALKDEWTRVAMIILAAELPVILTGVGFMPHYVAPTTGLIFFIIVQSMRYLSRLRWRQHRYGSILVLELIILFLFSFGDSLLTEKRADPDIWYRKRAAIINQLEHLGGKHLIIVRYGPNHTLHHEWVSNEADIDNAKVVWAREMEPEQNQLLFQYFKGRCVWLLVENNSSTRVTAPLMFRIR